MGSALARTFQQSGYRVFATARNSQKLADVRAAGIETLSLDVVSQSSITACVSQVRKLSGSLDILVNNAGAVYHVPLSDASITDAKNLFDLNVWANLAMIQAFLPLLLKSTNPVIVNHTSIVSIVPLPFHGVYCASKAAAAALTVALRSELAPFNIKVMEIKSGNVKSKINSNKVGTTEVSSNSLYYSARDFLKKILSGENFAAAEIPAEEWSKKVVAAVSRRSPPHTLWVGGNWRSAYWATALLPSSMIESICADTGGMNRVGKEVQQYGIERAIADAYSEE